LRNFTRADLDPAASRPRPVLLWMPIIADNSQQFCR
jgi:hypothetical protein